MGTRSAQSSLSIYAACPVRLPCLLTRPSPRLQFGRSVVGHRQGAACSSRSFKAKSLTRTLSAPSWTAGRLNSNQVPTNGWALPPASPTTAASSPWSGLCPRSCPPQQRPARAGCLVEPGIQAPGRGRLPRLHAGAHLSGGRSDQAGFVQVIQGHSADMARLAGLGRAREQTMAEQAPHILGMTVAEHADRRG